MKPRRPLAELLYWYPYRWAVSYMPPGSELGINRTLSYVRASAQPEEVARVTENVRRGLPTHPNPGRVARDSLVSRFLAQGAAISLPRLSSDTLDRYIEVRGLEHIHQALERGGGAILTYPHTGPYNLAVTALSLMGVPINRLGLSDPQDDPQVDPKLSSTTSFLEMPSQSARRDLESKIPGALYDGRGYLRPVLRALRQGQVVLVSYDGSPPGVEQVGRRVRAELMGQAVDFPVGPVYLALRSGVPLLPISLLPRREGGPYRLTIQAPMALDHKGDLGEALSAGANHLAHHLQECLRPYPGAWQLWSDFEPGGLIP